MKKIIILGASVYQVPLIKKAKELGLYTIVVSIPGDYQGFLLSDKNYFIDTRNKEEILKIAKNEKVDGICTSGTDVAVITIGYVNEKLGLNGISYDTAVNSTNKYFMKQKFIDNNINTAKFLLARDGRELKKAFDQLNVDKAVAKIVDKSGSRGIRAIDKYSDYEYVFYEVCKETQMNYIVVEEFVYGTEIGIDVFVSNSEIVCFVPHNKMIESLNGVGIPSGHIVPYTPYYNEENRLLEETKKIIKAFGIKDGALNIDAFVKNNGDVSIIEIGSRAGATGIPEIITNYLGHDYYEMILNSALNLPIDIINKPQGKPSASLLIFSDKDGIYSGYELDDVDDIVITMDYRIGHKIEKITDGTSRIGQVIIKADSIEELNKKIEYVRNNIKIYVI